MKVKIKDINNLIFYVSYFFFLLYAFFGVIENYEAPLKLLTYISMILIFVYVILNLNNYKFKELCLMILLSAISFVYVFVSGNYVFLKFVLILIICKNISLKKRLSFDLKLRSIFTVLMIVFCTLGISNDVTFLYNGNIRHSLGFSNPNVLGLNILIIILEILYLNRDKLKLKTIIFCLILILVTNYFDGCRTVLYLYVLTIFFLLMYKYNKNFLNNKIVKFLVTNSSYIFMILLYIVYLYYCKGSSFALQIDKLFSGRLLNMDYFVRNYDINLFGNEIASANKSCDTTIVYLLYSFGVSGLLIYLIAIKKLFKHLFENKEYMLIIIMLVFVIYGLNEKLWLFADFNLIITTFGLLIFDNKKVQ